MIARAAPIRVIGSARTSNPIAALTSETAERFVRERYRIAEDAGAYFLTYSVVDWLPVFVSDEACGSVVDALNFCNAEKALRINAYVIMPTHLHLIAFDGDGDSDRLAETLTAFRKFTGRALADFCERRMPGCFTHVMQAAAGSDRNRQFWQASRHPEGLETERFWKQKLDYLHENPCRKGLVLRAEHWRFSSAAFYLSDGELGSEVEIAPIPW
jgi:hypothetical protein